MSETPAEQRARALREGWEAREEYLATRGTPPSSVRPSGIYTARRGRTFTPGPYAIDGHTNPYGTGNDRHGAWLAEAYYWGWHTHAAVHP